MKDNIVNVSREIITTKPNDTIRMTHSFRRKFLGLSSNDDFEALLDMPIISMRIIFKIISDLKYHQFSLKNQTQFSLFEEEFKTVNNSYATMKFKISDIEPKRSKNLAAIRRGLAFLVSYKSDWHKSTNEKGKEISVFGGLINDPSISEGEISFLLSGHWMEKIVKNEFSNEIFYQIAWALTSTKQMHFFLWLQELKPDGTSVKYQTLNSTYKLNYSSARDVAKEFLKPMKKAFETNGNKSFNYSINGDKVNVVPFTLTGALLPLKKDTIDSFVIKQRTAYLKKRHSLGNTEAQILKNAMKVPNQFNLIDIAYKEVVKDFRVNKEVKLTDLSGRELLEKIQLKINDIYPVYRLTNDLPNLPKLI
jgi:hypothetical protein